MMFNDYEILNSLCGNIIEASMILWFTRSISEKRTRSINTFFARILFVIVYTSVSMPLRKTLILETLVTIFLCGIVFWYIYRPHWRQIIAVSVVFAMCVECCWGFITAPLVYGNGMVSQMVRSDLFVAMGLLVLRYAVLGLVLFVIKKQIDWRIDFEISAPMFFIFLILLVLSIGIKLILYPSFGNELIPEGVVTRIVLMVMGAAIFACVLGFVFFLSSLQHRYRLQLSENAVRHYAATYAIKQEADESLKRMKHDIKNHLNCLKELSNDRSVGDHIDSIQRQISRLSRETYTGIPCFDVVLNEKIDAAAKQAIDTKVVMTKNLGSFLDNATICSVVGNALDNAIEAASAVEEVEKRLVTVKSFEKMGIMYLCFSNYYKRKPIRTKNGLLSAKRGYKTSGLGMASIEYCLEPYSGTLQYEIEDDFFSLILAIPCPDERTLAQTEAPSDQVGSY